MALTFPAVCESEDAKLTYCFRALELLKQWHNAQGAKVEAGEIMLETFYSWQEAEFLPRVKTLKAFVNGHLDKRPILNEEGRKVPNPEMVLFKEESSAYSDWDEFINIEAIEKWSF